MAKAHDFRINVQKATFDGPHVAVHYGSDSYYIDEPFTGTLAQALVKRIQLSKDCPMPHAAFIRMRYREDRKATGLSNVKPLYYDGNKREE